MRKTVAGQNAGITRCYVFTQSEPYFLLERGNHRLKVSLSLNAGLKFPPELPVRTLYSVRRNRAVWSMVENCFL